MLAAAVTQCGTETFTGSGGFCVASRVWLLINDIIGGRRKDVAQCSHSLVIFTQLVVHDHR